MVSVFTLRREGKPYKWDPVLQMWKFSFKIKSNPLANNMGNHSVGKWDSIPKWDKMRIPQLGWMGCNPPPFFCLRHPASKNSKPWDRTIFTLEGYLLVHASHMRGNQLFITKFKNMHWKMFIHIAVSAFISLKFQYICLLQ